MANIEQKIGEIKEWLGTGTLNFFGRQFAGKDLQAGKLACNFGVKVISSGDIFRNSNLSPEVRAQIDSGELSPSEEFRAQVLPYLGKAAFMGKPLVLSSVGRMHGEEQDVIDTVTEAGHPTMAVPFLDITEDESFKRMAESESRGCADDTPEGLRKRLDLFNESTLHVLGAYSAMGLLVPVDAMPAEDVVFENLVHALHEHATN